MIITPAISLRGTMKQSNSKKFVGSVLTLFALCVFSWASLSFFRLTIRAYGETIVAIPIFGEVTLEKLLPIGFALLFLLGFVPYVLSTFFQKNYIWVLFPVMGILVVAYILFNDDLVRQVLATLFSFYLVGYGAGTFIYSFKWRVIKE
jgi:hypothetical protein